MTIFRISFLVLFITQLNSQSLFDFSLHDNCSYFGEKITEDIYGFESSSEAEEVITKILEKVGLEKNFEIRSANVPNAAAVINGSTRYILYSENFIESINSETGSKWAAISILAHEIGHHLNGHTLDNLGSRPPIELEADKFSGFVLALMGASLNQAQLAMANLASSSGSVTHPPKSARLEAIAVGYKNAIERMGGNSTGGGGSQGGGSQEDSSSSQTRMEEKASNLRKNIDDEIFAILACNALKKNGGGGSKMLSVSSPTRFKISGNKVYFGGSYTAKNYLVTYGGDYSGIYDLNKSKYLSVKFELHSGLKEGPVATRCLR